LKKIEVTIDGVLIDGKVRACLAVKHTGQTQINLGHGPSTGYEVYVPGYGGTTYWFYPKIGKLKEGVTQFIHSVKGEEYIRELDECWWWPENCSDPILVKNFEDDHGQLRLLSKIDNYSIGSELNFIFDTEEDARESTLHYYKEQAKFFLGRI
jgi:hypothetical protein